MTAARPFDDPVQVVRHAGSLGYDVRRVALSLGVDPAVMFASGPDPSVAAGGGQRVAHDTQGGAGADPVDDMEQRLRAE
jgi:hypothetical protein